MIREKRDQNYVFSVGGLPCMFLAFGFILPTCNRSSNCIRNHRPELRLVGVACDVESVDNGWQLVCVSTNKKEKRERERPRNDDRRCTRRQGRTKRPKEYSPDRIAKYAVDVNHTWRLNTPRRTSPQLNFSSYSLARLHAYASIRCVNHQASGHILESTRVLSQPPHSPVSLLCGKIARGSYTVWEAEIGDKSRENSLPSPALAMRFVTGRTTSPLKAHTRSPSIIRIHRQPSRPPRGPIADNPRASRPAYMYCQQSIDNNTAESTTGTQTSKGARQGRGRVKDANSQGEFSAGVQTGQVQHHAGQQAALGHPKQSADNPEAGEATDETKAHGDDAPHGCQAGQEDLGRNLFEEQVAWQFAIVCIVRCHCQDSGRQTSAVGSPGYIGRVEDGQSSRVL